MKESVAMPKVWVLGAGQLGAMLRHAGMPLAIDVLPVPLDSTQAPTLGVTDIVTPEIEHWPDSAATRALSTHSRFINHPVFARLADRLTQKSLLDELGLATAPWCPVTASTLATDLYATLGERVLLKRRMGGYDGKGQYWLRRAAGDEIPTDWYDAAIAESAIDFDEEVSLVGMRDRDGNCFFYPLTLNLHTSGILAASVAPLARLAPLQSQAEAMLRSLLDSMDYVGVMAMECFRVDDRLLINELAPRVHNSGHWTQAGASVSQFEAHLRAICGLPLATPAVRGTTVMINLLGTERNDQWLSIPECELYWYGKAVRPGRKVGHINLCTTSPDDLRRSLGALTRLLPDHYGEVLSWAADSLP